MQALTMVNCSYPECSKLFYITVEQKRELKTFHYLKYGKTADVYCSKDCQVRHLKDLSEAEFLRKGTLKNREYALIVHDADVTKRLKEKEVHLITGNETEQRIRCVVEKLLSMSERRIKLFNGNQFLKMKYITPKEIQSFLLMEVDEGIRVNPERIQVTASEIMTKSTEMFPDVVSIEWINKKDRVLVSIK